ncbi:MAG: Fur family transcriptional regulator [Erysipelotrichaceae bacterium]|nr:Fur family transcriptional regulator [Erysipelotrichaceae bacterium]
MIPNDTIYKNLKAKGYKLTSQRKIIIEALIEHSKEHLTAEQLHQVVRQSNPDIGLATVYRNVKMLCDLGIIETLNLNDGFVRYEIAPVQKKHRHHHLICTNCHQVIEVEEDLMDSIEQIFAQSYGFKVSDHETKFYGLCARCQKKTNH